jgi:hypothetical protein
VLAISGDGLFDVMTRNEYCRIAPGNDAIPDVKNPDLICGSLDAVDSVAANAARGPIDHLLIAQRKMTADN